MTFIDTSVVIDFLAGDQKIVSMLQQLAETETIKTTTITEYELAKYHNETKTQAAQDFIETLVVYSFDRASARKAAALFKKLKKTGKMINENDLLIAGIVLAYGDVFLTRDQRLATLNEPNIRLV